MASHPWPGVKMAMGLPQFAPIEAWLRDHGFQELPRPPWYPHGRISHFSEFQRAGTRIELLLEGLEEWGGGEIRIELLAESGGSIQRNLTSWARWLKWRQVDAFELEEQAAFLYAKIDELERAAAGLDRATLEAELTDLFEDHKRLGNEWQPMVRAALEEPTPNADATAGNEAWVAFAMNESQTLPRYLEGLDLKDYESQNCMALLELIYWGETMNATMPTAAQIAGALWRMRARGWLLLGHGPYQRANDRRTSAPGFPNGRPMAEECYGLTKQGLATVRAVLGTGRAPEKLQRLERWLEANPPQAMAGPP